MATNDTLKLDCTSELRTLTNDAAKAFDQINLLLAKMARYGYIGDAPNVPPDDPIVDADYAGSTHEAVTAEQFYGVVAFFAGLVQSVDPVTAKLLARFGKPMSQQ